MTIASRFYACLAAFALVLAGITAFPTSSARAQGSSATSTALIAGTVITAAVLTLVLVVNKDDKNDDEGPQSP